MNVKKTLCLTLIASLALSACDNQAGGSGAGKAPLSINTVLNLKDNLGLINPDYRQDIFELNDIAVFDESGVKSGVFYLDSTKGLQVLNSAIIPKGALNDNPKFLEFMKSNKDKFSAIAANYPKPDNSLAMYYDKNHNTIHWLALNDTKTKWQEYGIDISKNQPMISMLQESDIDPNINRDNLAVSFRASDIDGETIIDVTYAESDLATDLDGQPVNGVAKISYLARAGVAAASESTLLNNQVYTPVLLGVNGILENSYIYDGNGTTKDEANQIKKLYPKAKVGEFTDHKPGFMDTLRNLSPVLALTIIAGIVGGIHSVWKRYSSAKELKIREAKFDAVATKVVTEHIIPSEAEKIITVKNNLEERIPLIENVIKLKEPTKSLAQQHELIPDGNLTYELDLDGANSITLHHDSHGGPVLWIFYLGEGKYKFLINDVAQTGLDGTKLKNAIKELRARQRKVITVSDLEALLGFELTETTTLDNPKVITNIKDSTRLGDSGENGIAKNLLDKKYDTGEQNTAVSELSDNFASEKFSNGLEISLPRDYAIDWRENAALKSIVKEATGRKVVAVGSDSGGRKITYQLDGEITRFDKDDFNIEFKDELIDMIKSDFDIVDASGRLRKRYPIVAATISALGGTAGYFIWKDKYAELGSWVFGGCSKYVCNSIFLYGDKSSESSIGLKSDTLFQQVPFTDDGKNYILNVAQVFAQTCYGMIKTSSESQTMVLYAGDSDVNVGKHYLVSDVNNKLCPIGNMDMSKFIESVGATQ
ncbi:MAG: hypothetical protein K2X04_12255 [Burkholderiales bacterium]|nr:hypothetical protein [Burkholderiales bacterium]